MKPFVAQQAKRAPLTRLPLDVRLIIVSTVDHSSTFNFAKNTTKQCNFEFCISASADHTIQQNSDITLGMYETTQN